MTCAVSNLQVQQIPPFNVPLVDFKGRIAQPWQGFFRSISDQGTALNIVSVTTKQRNEIDVTRGCTVVFNTDTSQIEAYVVNEWMGLADIDSDGLLTLPGGIAFGDDSGTTEGTVRWTGDDLEVYMDGSWTSLTQGNGTVDANNGAANRIAYFSDSNTIEGDSSDYLTWDDSTKELNVVGVTTVQSTSPPFHVIRDAGASASGYYGMGHYKVYTTGSGNNEMGGKITMGLEDSNGNYDFVALGSRRDGGNDDGRFRIDVASSGTLTERFTIRCGGDVGIGISSPAYGFDVARPANDYVARIHNTSSASGASGLIIECGPEDQSAIDVYYLAAWDYQGGAEGYLRNHNGTFEIAQACDPGRKVEVKPTRVKALDVIGKFELKEFKYKSNQGHLHPIGFVADNCEQAFGEMVSPDENGEKFISTATLIPVLVKAVQELVEKVQKLNGE